MRIYCPPKTDVINGVLSPQDDDYFRWEDLAPGSTFTVNGTTSSGGDDEFRLYDNSQTERLFRNGTPFNGSVTVPLDGTLVGQFHAFEGGGSYTLNVNATFVPEPGAGSLLSLGALGLLGRRRKTNDES